MKEMFSVLLAIDIVTVLWLILRLVKFYLIKNMLGEVWVIDYVFMRGELSYSTGAAMLYTAFSLNLICFISSLSYIIYISL